MRVPPQLTGNHPLANWLNKLRDAVAANEITSFMGGRFNRGPNGTQLSAGPGGNRPEIPPSSTFGHFKIVSHGSDTLTCKKWDNDADDWEAGNTTVYKPYLLRFTSAPSSRVIDSITISYSAYDTAAQTRTAEVGIGGSTYTEVLTSRYLADDLIIAVYTEESGGTRWADLNVDGRAWAKKYT